MASPSLHYNWVLGRAPCDEMKTLSAEKSHFVDWILFRERRESEIAKSEKQ
jgi:hypothetical protein